jgi:hypothetical protein
MFEKLLVVHQNIQPWRANPAEVVDRANAKFPITLWLGKHDQSRDIQLGLGDDYQLLTTINLAMFKTKNHFKIQIEIV